MPDKKPGMAYDDVKKRIKRIASTDKGGDKIKTNLVNSLVNQVSAREGEGAVKSLVNELRGTRVKEHWGYKTRGNYTVGICLKDCIHKDTEVCESCFKFSNLEQPKEVSESTCKDSVK